MRKICIALCLSLFASLIHAAVMPIEQPASQSSVTQAHHQVAVGDNSAHHCDEVANNTSYSNSKQPCHGDSSMLLRLGSYFTLCSTGSCGFQCQPSRKLFLIGASAYDQLHL